MRTTSITTTALLALALIGCAQDRSAEPAGRDLRIIAVTHGQSADPFWSIVSNGMKDAADDLGVRLEYQAPTSFDMVRMSQLIDAAVASRPHALIVSIPDAEALAGALRSAATARIPVISINSGADAWQRLNMLAHIGQTEHEAGRGGGEQLAKAGARSVLCINHEVGNGALDERCRGVADAMKAASGSATVLAVNLADPDDAQQRISNALRSSGAVDGMIALGPGGAAPALAALKNADRIKPLQFATFDLSPEVLQAIQDGRMLFAIDQQPYLQGYLGVTLPVKYIETGVMAGGGQVIRTGPGYVTRDNVAQVMRNVERGVR